MIVLIVIMIIMVIIITIVILMIITIVMVSHDKRRCTTIQLYITGRAMTNFQFPN